MAVYCFIIIMRLLFCGRHRTQQSVAGTTQQNFWDNQGLRPPNAVQSQGGNRRREGLCTESLNQMVILTKRESSRSKNARLGERPPLPHGGWWVCTEAAPRDGLHGGARNSAVQRQSSRLRCLTRAGGRRIYEVTNDVGVRQR